MDQLQSRQWYWIRRDDGGLAPYQFHRVRRDKATGVRVAEFYVGSLLQSWPMSRVIAQAQMPVRDGE